MTAPSDVVYHLSSYSDTLDEILPKILALSTDIFESEPDSKYASLTLWKDRLSHPTSAIIYISHHSPDASPYAFLFAYPRSHDQPLSDGETESLHIWLAGVSPSRRREGSLQRMMDSLLSCTPSLFTICTIPSRFPNMWDWLNKQGWSVERVLGSGKVLLSKHV